MEERKIYPSELEDEDMEAQNIIADDNNSDYNCQEDQEMALSNAENQNDLDDLIEELEHDPYNIDIYQKIIENYKKLEKNNLVQDYRKRAAKDLLLPLKMWKDWIEDERAESSNFKERVKICEIFNQALDTFNFFELSKDYAQYILELYTDPDNDGSIDVDQVKRVLERVLRIWMLDFARSSEIWQYDLKFESEVRGWKKEEEGKRIIAIRGLYRRKLIFPTMDLDSVWSDYEEWESDKSELQGMKDRYLKASEKVNRMIKFEDNITEYLKEIEITRGNFIYN